MDIPQTCIVVFGLTAIFLISCKDEKIRRWGYVSGLISQPFWSWSAYTNGQWGIFILSFFYAASWLKGIWNFWVRN